MATVGSMTLVNELKVVPAFETPMVYYLGDLLDGNQRRTVPDGVRLWVRNPSTAGPQLVDRVVTTYPAGHSFGVWAKPVATNPHRFQIYWSVVRLMEREPGRWPGLIDPKYHIPLASFTSDEAQKRVWFGDRQT